jgi:hypothetical protein
MFKDEKWLIFSAGTPNMGGGGVFTAKRFVTKLYLGVMGVIITCFGVL